MNGAKTTIVLEGHHIRPDGNKGDELMLHTVMRRLRAADENVRLAVDPRMGSFIDRTRLGLYQALWPFSAMRLSTSVGYLVLQRYAETFGIVPESEVDWVLNFQGYRYADIGLYETRKDLAAARRRMKSRGSQYIYLPQAFGPFSDRTLRKAAYELFSMARLICARDERSREHLIDIGLPPSAVDVFPDITIAETVHAAEEGPQEEPVVCVIPNIWMIERTDRAQSEAYVDFLVFVCREVQRRGLVPRLVNHAPFQDEPVAKRVADEVGGNVEVVCESDPRQVKATIGKSMFVVGSRYHALVAALSQSVPAIGTSWAHKYETLYEDYGCPELLLSAAAPRTTILATIDRLLDSRSRTDLKKQLDDRNFFLKSRVEDLWTKVHAMIGLPSKS